jgi:formimidoylglutamate deiminase
MSTLYACEHLLGQNGFLSPGWFEVDDAGFVSAVGSGEAAANKTVGQRAKPPSFRKLDGYVIPGLPNLHCHALQRAIAGRGEHASVGDDFFSWRQAMYRSVERAGPEELEAVAAQAYLEMLERGFTSVAEFHYLHLDPKGRPYEDRAELSERIVAAAQKVGIGLTLLPVLYMASGFGEKAPEPAQRRFVLGLEAFLELCTVLHARHGGDPRLRIGAAPHSLRAVPEAALRACVQGVRAVDENSPLHIHVAEQRSEVEACLAWSGARPVEWLLDHIELDARWCVVHATHMTVGETDRLAASGAVAGLCPTTEANLGDGIFPLRRFLDAGGSFGVGSDSNVSVNPLEELRWLEYSQRLVELGRNVAADGAQPSTGARLYLGALAGGARALGQPIGGLAPGLRADVIVVDGDHPALTGARPELFFDALVFASSSSPVREVMVGGRSVVTEGRHVLRDAIRKGYARAIADLEAD